MICEKPAMKVGSRVAVIMGEETVEQTGTILAMTEVMWTGTYQGRHCVLVQWDSMGPRTANWLPIERARLLDHWETRASILESKTAAWMARHV